MSYGDHEHLFWRGFMDEWARNHPDAHEDVLVAASDPEPVTHPHWNPSVSANPVLGEKLIAKLSGGQWHKLYSIPGIKAEGALEAMQGAVVLGAALERRDVTYRSKAEQAYRKALGKQDRPGGMTTTQVRLAEAAAGEQRSLF